MTDVNSTPGSRIEGMKRTLLDDLTDAEQEVPERAPCDFCGAMRFPIELVHSGELTETEDDNGYMCSHCIDEAARLALSLAPVPIEELWEDVRARRNQLLDKHSWSIREDSPLSLACKAEFLIYLRLLHRITLDYEEPALVQWPAVPELVYALTGE